MNPLTLLARRVGAHGAPRVAGVAVTAMLLVAGGISAVVVAQEGPGWAEGIQQRIQSIKEAADGDRDGMADALENRVGSDPTDPDTLGGGVLDGWLYHWFGESVEWNDPSLLDVRVMTPPTQALPEPLRAPGAVLPPTVAELYALDQDWRDPDGRKVAWWAGEAIDPLQWDNDGDGVADAWLVQHGVDPLTVELDAPAGDPSMTVREKYLLGLDPSTPDSDGDGLADSAELEGVAHLDGQTRRFQPTDPTRFSSRGDRIGDGFLVRFGLDPHDDDAGEASPAGDGITVREAFEVTRDHCLAAEPDGCDWTRRLRDGPLLDPTTWDSLGDGVPDAWSLRDPHGRAHPLEDATTTAAYTTAEWDVKTWGGLADDLSGVVVDAQNPAPEASSLTFHDLYTFQRPETWDEARDGPWWGGLPTVIETPEGGLPPAVAMRGWSLQVDLVLGREPGKEPEPERMQTVHVGADPRKPDTDGDGLTDLEEYYGVVRGAAATRTDPSDPDTDGDGLTDCQELLHGVRHECEDPAFDGGADGGLGTDALRRDTSGSFLTDGQEFEYWGQREQTALAAGGTDPASGLSADALGPLGDVDGDGAVNILDRDGDGDGLPDGAELDPNRFLPQASGIVRPATDPAVADTDRDELPDAWEVQWSQDRVFGCKAPCSLPSNTRTVDGWPIHPGLQLSLGPLADGAPLPPGLQSDGDVNLANDRAVGPAGVREFTSGLAYRYDLDPYEAMTDPADGIPDMFAILWGVENVPDFVDADWTRAKADDLAGDLALRGFTLGVDNVVINPRLADAPGAADAVTKDSNLLGLFTGRDKGTWVYTNGAGSGACDDRLPASGLRSESGVPRDPAQAGETLPDRSGLPRLDAASGSCWSWVAYPVHRDMAQRTDPWRHDTDADGLPDAWEAHYDITAAATARLRLAECDETPVDGVVSVTNCLTYADAYRLGLDPTVQSGDTDGGGVPDWLEVQLGLDPLNPADDSPEQDWDGNGLPNIVELRLGLDPLSPDTDGDGLLDGGDLASIQDLRALLDLQDGQDVDGVLRFLKNTQGRGDLCLPGPAHADFSKPMPNMDERPDVLTEPAPGPLTYRQVHDWYVERGILHETDHNGRCPEHQVLFKRESIRPPGGGVLGAGRDSDSLRRDTSGDGVADGWLVHWLDHSTDASMEGPLWPGTDTRLSDSWDPDEDLLTTPREHAGPAVPLPQALPWAAPAGWDDARDGVWWGGMDPAAADSAGSSPWYKVSREDGFYLQQPALADLDSDGVPDRYDPFPALDHHNEGIVAWSEAEGRYVTDHASLWPALEARAGASLLDGDDDRVPDFLDRARVRLALDAFGGGIITKQGDEDHVVAGTLTVAEPVPGDAADYDGAPTATAGDGAAVGHAAVRVLVRDGNGLEALAGVGLTGPDGSFSIPLRVGDAVTAPPCASAVVAGRPCDPDAPTAVPSRGLDLRPGPLSVRVEVEANDPALHPLTFDGAGADAVVAYKRADGTTAFALPDGLGPASASALKAVALDDDGDPTGGRFRHDASAVFPASSTVLADVLTLRTQTVLTITDATDAALGEPVLVNGTFLDQIAGVPLPGHPVEVRLGGIAPVGGDPVTDDDGVFRAVFPTDSLPPGPYAVTAEVHLPSGSFLEEPDPASDAVEVSRTTSWHDVVVNGEPLPAGSELAYPVGDAVRVQARLLDHRDEPVAGKDVVARVVETVGDGPGTPLGPTPLRTDAAGRVELDLGALPAGLALAPLDLLLEQADAPADDGEVLRIILKPVHATAITGLQEVTVDAGRPAVVEGFLVRVDGTPAYDADATFTVRPTDASEPVITIEGTEATGRFEFATTSAVPASTAWTVTYTPGHEQLLGTDAEVVTRHVADTAIVVDPVAATRDVPVEVTGVLQRADGTPVAGTVRATWDGEEHRNETTDGAFAFTLPPLDVGLHPLVLRFDGSAVERPTQTPVEVAVREPTTVGLHARNLTVREDAAEPTGFLSGNLTDGAGAGLGQRPVVLDLAGPDGRTATAERFTALDGTFRFDPSDLPTLAPGDWTARVHYAGDLLETPAEDAGDLTVRHVVLLDLTRAPAEIRPGQDVRLRGVIGTTPGDPLDPVAVQVLLDDALVAEATVVPGDPWRVDFTAPQVAHGARSLRVTGLSPHEDVEVLPVEENLTVVSGVTVNLTEEPGEARTVLVTALDSRSGYGVPLDVVLLRSVDGVPVETYTVATDDEGSGALRLPPDAAGNVSVVSVSHPVYRLDPQTASLGVVAPAPPGTPLWVYLVGGTALLAGVALLAALVVWRRRQRSALAAAIEEARRLLIDPGASPARVIEAMYEHLLRILTDAGDPVGEEDTVRDIARRATRALRLPPGPMRTMSRLFELAKYSDRELSDEDRDDALEALRVLAGSLGTEVRVQQGAQTADRMDAAE